MNRDTGRVYRGELAILEAELRGEPIVPVSERVADAVEIGMHALSRAERRAAKHMLKPLPERPQRIKRRDKKSVRKSRAARS